MAIVQEQLFFRMTNVNDKFEVTKTEVDHAEQAEYDIVRGKVSEKGIVLRPQPTNDPNESLVRQFDATYCSI